ncbi:hypothetical protein [uncultured Shimia sp.]|uniref:hypothetical protein n=1 Tax=uncultured Shimia sp. TaxID=573152 RepID=UPI002613C28C|nr:hypothetical protein [uncultured Shimia sp.]
MSQFPDQNAELTEVFVVAKSINSLGQIEATVGSMHAALRGPLLESDNVYLSENDALDAKARSESGTAPLGR